jgi:hypothetical protein
MLNLNNFNAQRLLIIVLLCISVIWFFAQPDYEPIISALSYILSLVGLYASTENTGVSRKTVRPGAQWFFIPAALVGILFFLLSIGRLSQITDGLFNFIQSLLSENTARTFIICYVAGFLGIMLVGSRLERAISATRLIVEAVIGLIISIFVGIIAAISSAFALLPIVFIVTTTNQGTGRESEASAGLNTALLTSPLVVVTVIIYLISIKQRTDPNLTSKVRAYFAMIFSSLLMAIVSQDTSVMLITVIVGSIAFLITHIVWTETHSWTETNIVVGALIGFSIGALEGGRTEAVLCLIWGAIIGYLLAQNYAKYNHIVEDIENRLYFDA